MLNQSDGHTLTERRHHSLDAYAVSGTSPPAGLHPLTVQDAIERWSTPKAWLTLADVADELGVSIRTVMRWAQSGQIPSIELPGGRRRIHRDTFDAWLLSLRTPPPSES